MAGCDGGTHSVTTWGRRDGQQLWRGRVKGRPGYCLFLTPLELSACDAMLHFADMEEAGLCVFHEDD